MILKGDETQQDLARERTILALQRNRLAAQRTYNAWLRTGLAGVGGGIAVIKFLPFAEPIHRFAANIAGQFLIFWGICIFLYALVTYIQIIKKLAGIGEEKVKYLAISLITFSLVAISIILFIITSASVKSV